MSFAAGDTASLAEAELQPTAAEPPRHVSLPVPNAPRPRAQECTVSDYALHWLSNTKLHRSKGATAAPDAEAAAQGWELPHRHTDSQQQGSAPRTKSFGCQAEAKDISAEVSGLHKTAGPQQDASLPSMPLQHSEQRRPQVEHGATAQLSKHTQFRKVHSGTNAEPGMHGDSMRAVELQAGVGGTPCAAAAGDLVPLLEGLQSSSCETAGGSPVSARMLHPSPMRGSGGSAAAGAWEVRNDRAAEAAPAAVSAEHWRRQDRYWTPAGWADSIETPGLVAPADDC